MGARGEAELEALLRRVDDAVRGGASSAAAGEALAAPGRRPGPRRPQARGGAPPGRPRGQPAGRSPEVGKVCGEASARVRRIERRWQTAQSDFERQRIPEDAEWWLNSIVNRMIPRLGRLPSPDVDLLVGCLARVEHAARTTLPSMNRLRAAAQPYLRGIR